MEKNVRAFFYEYKYYLFPESCNTLEALKGLGNVTATRLKEVRCMAPDFIYESMEEEELEITQPEHLFEVFVNLYTGEEYDGILSKQVDRVCPGCERFIPDGDPRDTGNLEGHHREISLGGVCYEREDKDEAWDFSTCAEVFWYRISQQINTLAEYVDRGNQKKINELVNAELKRFFYPVKAYGGVCDGKYCLMFAPDYNHMTVVRKAVAFLAEVASSEKCEMQQAGWTVFPYRKKGVYRYKGKHNFKRLKARIVPSGNPNCCSLEVYFKKPLKEKKRERLIQDLFDYLSAELGEEKVQAYVSDTEIVSDDREMQPVCSLLGALEEGYSENFGDGSGYPASYFFHNGHDEHDKDLPFREKISSGVTDCPEITFLTYQSLDRAWWLSDVQFFYLYVPRRVDETGEIVSWYLTNGDLVPEPLRDPEQETVAGGSAGLCVCGEGEGFIIDCFVTSEKAFFRKLRIIAPVLKAFDAKLVTVKKDGIMAYSCGYDFTPIEF